MDSEYRICNRCVIDTTDINIKFDEWGNCNHCNKALEQKDKVWRNTVEGKRELDIIISTIKKRGKGKKYDCIIGISGGIDSSYVAYLCHLYGLRMLGVHIDAGWNTEISEKNIKNLCEKLDIDLIIRTINKKEMMDIQRAYFRAEVINQDVPQDHAFFSELYKCSLENGQKYFISGGNFSSECILPKSWGYNSMDSDNLKDIHKQYGNIEMKEYPTLSFYDNYIKLPFLHGLKKIRPLNYINYDKEKALDELHDKIDFEYYGGKHCESVFTRLYQGYILPEKFGVDKRRAHLSSLIVSEQLTREEALEILKENPYIGTSQQEEDINIFINNIGIDRQEFDSIIYNKTKRNHSEFKNNINKVNLIQNVKKVIGI